MTLGQLAILPMTDGRTAERRIVNLAARLREPGARIAVAEVQDLSVTGFMARTDMQLEPGNHVWLKLPGLEPQNCRVVWAEEGKAGFEFATPLHPSTLELLVSSGRRPVPRGHFGAQG
ncbi:MAG TPA: PilZ domain-containing protein [Allosphingosinicella sp.]|nr:PilZ domain-containing protein [Allosphingosinicella sp.]